MKKLLLTVILVMSVCIGVFAQQLTYQAVIRDLNQQLVVNTGTTTYITIQFSNGDQYRDTVEATTNIHGLLTFEFGDASLAGRDWENATITTTVLNNTDNSIVYVNNQTRPVSAVPYALSVGGQSIQNYLNAHHYIDADSVRRTISDTASALRTAIETGGGVTGCNEVNACVANALGDFTSTLNHIVDTIAQNNQVNADWNATSGKAQILHKPSLDTMASVSNLNTLAGRVTAAEGHIATARDSISTLQTEIMGFQTETHSHANKAVLDRTQQAYRTADSTKLAGIETLAQVNVNADWNATSADAQILNKPSLDTMASVSNLNTLAGRVTTAEGEIDALQATTASNITSSNLCNTIESSCTNVALENGNNVFTGKNTFSDTVTVPSGFAFGTTTTSTCNNVAVNACDLLTIFDSIQRRISNMEQNLLSEINNLRDTLQQLRVVTSPLFHGMTFAKTDSSLQVTADFADGGATITNYNFCIAEDSSMQSSTCVDSATNQCTFAQLQPGTTYYVTVTATNLKGSTTSTVESATTDYSAPVLADNPTATPESDTEISVQGSLTDMGGAPSTRVKVCAYTNTDYSDTPIFGSDSVITSVPQDYKVSVTGLTENTHYYLAVIADNGQKTDTVKTEATTLNVTVAIASNRTDTISVCGSIDTTVTYTAVLTGATPTTYVWKVNGTDSTAVTGNVLTVHYTDTTAGYNANIIICTVNGTSDTVKTVLRVKTTPTLGLCEDCNAGSITVKSQTNVASIVWHNSDSDSVSNSTTGLTQSTLIPAGIYTATAKSSDGCTVTRTATLGNLTAHPCTVTTKNSNERGSTTTTIDSVKDHQNNWYRVVQIGSQCWLAENMRCSTSPKGNLNPGDSATSSYKAYYYDYSNDNPLSLRERGYLYNWAGAIDTNANDYIGIVRPFH